MAQKMTKKVAKNGPSFSTFFHPLAGKKFEKVYPDFPEEMPKKMTQNVDEPSSEPPEAL